MTMTFSPAVKRKQKLRLAIYGVSGSGKTMSALRIAKGICGKDGKIAVIDTEHGSASLYSDRIPFDVVQIDKDKTVDRYAEALTAAVKAGYSVVIIDSLSHAWREILELVDRSAKGGNNFSGWSVASPKQKEFIETLLSGQVHIICTMRADTAWEQQTNERGKKEPVRIGLKPEQGKGIEFEFTMLMRLDSDNSAYFEKDRTGKYQFQTIKLLDEQFGEELVAWLESPACDMIDLRKDEEANLLVSEIVSLAPPGKTVNGAEYLVDQIRKAGNDRASLIQRLNETINQIKARQTAAQGA